MVFLNKMKVERGWGREGSTRDEKKKGEWKDLAFQGWMSPQSLTFKDHLGELVRKSTQGYFSWVWSYCNLSPEKVVGGCRVPG